MPLSLSATRSTSPATRSDSAIARYWLAEHHNMRGIASAATAVVIGHVAGGTSTIRVGAGGVMLPNHAPLVIAEQFGTLESLYPGRIDLGLGRAPGTDQTTARALRRYLAGGADNFPQDVVELQAYFRLGRARASRAGRAGRRIEGADLAARVEPLQRPARGRARPALRLRLALRARPSGGCPADLSQPFPSVGATRPALCHAGRQRLRGRDRCRGAPPFHVAAAGLREPPARHAWPAPAAGRQHGRAVVGDGAGGPRHIRFAYAVVGSPESRAARPHRLHRAIPGPTRSW